MSLPKILIGFAMLPALALPAPVPVRYTEAWSAAFWC